MPQLPESYVDTAGWDPRDVLSGGSRMVPIKTPVGDFRVWTKRVGTNPDLKVLLCTVARCDDGSRVLVSRACGSPGAGIEYYYYDQLGSFRSDQPDDPSLWDLARFVDEVEQVRQALGLDSGNFVLFGQSWGGILAMEYALHHQEHLKRPGHLQHDVERAALQAGRPRAHVPRVACQVDQDRSTQVGLRHRPQVGRPADRGRRRPRRAAARAGCAGRSGISDMTPR